MLRTYRNPIETFMVERTALAWVNWYANEAISEALANGKEVKNPKSKAKYLRAQKLCCLAFASIFGLWDQWKAKHERLSMWPPDTDFSHKGHQLRIIGVPADERFNFGHRLSGRIFDNDFNRGHTGYVLACWYAPYVDLVGWLPRERVKYFQDKNYYVLAEPHVMPMSSLAGLEGMNPWKDPARLERT